MKYKNQKNKLLEIFNVKSHIELSEYVKNNPDDENVKSLDNITKRYIQDEEVKKNEQ